jgi:hypothetical protein
MARTPQSTGESLGPSGLQSSLQSSSISRRHAVAVQRTAPPSSRRKDRVGPAHADPDSHSEIHPNHHLWRNGRLWWVAFTVIKDGWRQERVRESLGTDDVELARRRRDGLFESIANAQDCEISLRFPKARGDALAARANAPGAERAPLARASPP